MSNIIRGVETELLTTALPLSLWEEGIKQANRSTIRTFKTGAVIFEDMKDRPILEKGCSHTPVDQHYNGLSLHAEEDAVRKLYPDKPSPKSILIVTIGPSGNFAWSSRPCLNCSQILYGSCIERVYYAERDNSEEWVVNVEKAYDLLQRNKQSYRKGSCGKACRDRQDL